MGLDIMSLLMRQSSVSLSQLNQYMPTFNTPRPLPVTVHASRDLTVGRYFTRDSRTLLRASRSNAYDCQTRTGAVAARVYVLLT
jgi:hypothetical protein